MSRACDVICLSHLRWGFVFQRPNHLMSRCAQGRRVFFFEEPIYGADVTRLDVSEIEPNLFVCVPHLPAGVDAETSEMLQASLLRNLVRERGIDHHVQWFYTPMALPLVEGLEPAAVVFDCMDELSAFKGAPAALPSRERELFRRADVVFTGGVSLYEHKKSRHHRITAFPSSVDVAHYAKARQQDVEPADQAGIAHPRVGFFGVVDERLDLPLLARLADTRPDYQFVIVGPVVKIDPNDLPQRANIHYLGGKKYEELPAYLGGWDVAMMPFALNESSRFISPTKTLEYLAAHKPVVSTAIRDVVSPYGTRGIVRIADIETFAVEVDAALKQDAAAHEQRCEETLAQTSWERTWREMWSQVEEVRQARESQQQPVAQTMEGNETCSTI